MCSPTRLSWADLLEEDRESERHAVYERAGLASRAKQLQRSREAGEMQWRAFCSGVGKWHDPNRHTVESLKRFFAAREGLAGWARV